MRRCMRIKNCSGRWRKRRNEEKKRQKGKRCKMRRKRADAGKDVNSGKRNVKRSREITDNGRQEEKEDNDDNE